MTATDYAKTAAQWAKALKLFDPSLILILCGKTGHSSWDHEVLKACIPYIDMHSIHIYTAGKTNVSNAIAPLSAERAIEITSGLIDIARIEAGVPASIPKPTICFDEWNVWDPARAPGETGAEELYNLSDALAVAVWLNVFVRQSKYVGMANIAQTVNVISPLMTTDDGIVKQTTWWPLWLFSRFMRGWTIGVHVSSPAYLGATEPKWLQGVLEQGASLLDVSASVNEEGIVSAVVVNASDSTDYKVDLKGVGKDVTVYTVTGSSADVVNTAAKQEVELVESKWDGAGQYNFPKHSITMLRWNSGQRVNALPERSGERLNTRNFGWVIEKEMSA
jgi:alpha-N-arabinofuranosidase